MKRVMQALCAAAVVSAVAVPSVSNAGAQYQYANCTNAANGSGSCQGTMLGFRNSSNSSDYAWFFFNGSYRSFSAHAGGVFGYCTPNASVATLWDLAMNARGNFSISWDSTGTCTYLAMWSGSEYANY